MRQWALQIIEALGEPGVGALMALETVLPPIPSEVVLPFAGFGAARGDLDLGLTWVAATVGSLLGAWVLYGLGAAVGPERLHRLAARRWFIVLSPADLDRGERFFHRHGGKVVLLGRGAPFLRSVVSIPAGYVRMPLLRFTGLTAFGSGVWNSVLIGAGYRLGERWDRVGGVVGPVAYAVLAAALGAAWLVIRRRRHG